MNRLPLSRGGTLVKGRYTKHCSLAVWESFSQLLPIPDLARQRLFSTFLKRRTSDEYSGDLVQRALGGSHGNLAYRISRLDPLNLHQRGGFRPVGKNSGHLKRVENTAQRA